MPRFLFHTDTQYVAVFAGLVSANIAFNMLTDTVHPFFVRRFFGRT